MRQQFGISSLVAFAAASVACASEPGASAAQSLPRLKHHQPAAVVDLGVGLWSWPLPMDYNRDGRIDLVVAATGVPGNGIWFFENSGERDAGTRLPLFKPPVYVGSADSPARPRYDPQISYVRGEPIITTRASSIRVSARPASRKAWPCLPATSSRRVAGACASGSRASSTTMAMIAPI